MPRNTLYRLLQIPGLPMLMLMRYTRFSKISEFLLSFCYHNLSFLPHYEKRTFQEIPESPILPPSAPRKCFAFPRSRAFAKCPQRQ